MENRDIERYLKYIESVKNYSEHTIISYRNDLYEFSNYVVEEQFARDLTKIRNKRVIRSFINHLNKLGEKETTINRKLSSLRSFFEYLKKEEIIEVNYFNEVHSLKQEIKLPKFLSSREFGLLINSLNQETKLGRRNYILLMMMWLSGIRVSEVVNIKIKDINLEENEIKIYGKGKKERIVLIPNNYKEELKRYIREERIEIASLKDNNSRYLFLNKNGEQLTTRGVRYILDSIIQKTSGIYHLNPHMLRHSFATEMLNNGSDIRTVQELLGHKNINTTEIYTHVTYEKMMKDYNKNHPRAIRDIINKGDSDE